MTRKRRRKIRKSREVVLGVAMLSLVATMTGCDDSAQRRRCVDNTGKVVAEDKCLNDETRRYYGGGGPGIFFWYYGGGGYSPGSVVSGGSYAPPRGYGSYGGGRFSTSPGAGPSGGSGSPFGGSGSFGGSVSRGGFGGSSGAHGGGGIGG